MKRRGPAERMLAVQNKPIATTMQLCGCNYGVQGVEQLDQAVLHVTVAGPPSASALTNTGTPTLAASTKAIVAEKPPRFPSLTTMGTPK